MTDLIAPLTQFGAAGLIGALWIVERRSATARERQLNEAHDALARRRDELAVLVDAVRDNAQALASLQAAQHAVAEALDRLALHLNTRSPAAPQTPPSQPAHAFPAR